MKQYILKSELPQFIKCHKQRIAICIAAAVLAVIINVVCAVLMNSQNYAVMLTVNILSDILAGWFILFLAETRITADRKLISLAKSQTRQTVKGEVISIEKKTRRVYGLTCKVVNLKCADGEREIFVAEQGNIKLSEGTVIVITVNNIAVELL